MLVLFVQSPHKSFYLKSEHFLIQLYPLFCSYCTWFRKEALEMAQPLRHLFFKGQSLDPYDPHKCWLDVAAAFNSSTQNPDIGILGTSWLAGLAV